MPKAKPILAKNWTKGRKYAKILVVWGSFWFRHVLLDMTASGWHTLKCKTKF